MRTDNGGYVGQVGSLQPHAPEGMATIVPLTPGEIMRIEYALRVTNFGEVLDEDTDAGKLEARFKDLISQHDLIQL